MNLSGSLLIWTLGHMPAEFYNKLSNCYIGNMDWEGEDSWGNYFYVAFKEDLSLELLKTLEVHPMFTTSLWRDDEIFLAIFKFTEEQKEKIIQPFIAGKYSEIDREYVNKYFKQFNSTGQKTTNWQILNKDDDLRRSWERELNVTPYIRISIPEDAEVWSKIKKENEIIGYAAYAETQEEVLESM